MCLLSVGSDSDISRRHVFISNLISGTSGNAEMSLSGQLEGFGKMLPCGFKNASTDHEVRMYEQKTEMV